jgi:hypothetical protein
LTDREADPGFARRAICSGRVLASLKRPEEQAVDTHRFGRKIKLPATVAIKHELRMMMAQDINKAELETVRKTSEEKSDD